MTASSKHALVNSSAAIEEACRRSNVLRLVGPLSACYWPALHGRLPVVIVQIIRRGWRFAQLRLYFAHRNFAALLSVRHALLGSGPFPILDGGHGEEKARAGCLQFRRDNFLLVHIALLRFTPVSPTGALRLGSIRKCRNTRREEGSPCRSLYPSHRLWRAPRTS
jgi:hypothetical protein